MDNLIELKNISKDFPGVRALKNVSLNVRRGEVLALVGENGAGKSTLIKILTGVYKPTAGEVFWEGKKVHITMPAEAQRLGIATIYQEGTLCPNISVTENVFLGREITKHGFVDRKGMESKTREILNNLGVDIDPSAEVATLTTANQQLVEISRALMMNAKLLIMDEPTSSLSKHEVKALFVILKQLVEKGISILFISHRFEEIFEIADRITILRDGEYIATVSHTDAIQEKIVEMMIGRNVDTLYPRHKSQPGEEIFAVRNLNLQGCFYDISFTLRHGEVLGMSGLIGAGRTEVANAIFGMIQPESGEIKINGQWIPVPKNASEAMKYGIGLLPEDRKNQGLNLLMDVNDNIGMAWLCTDESKELRDLRNEHLRADKYIDLINIKTPTHRQLAMNLSGGNQQKIVVAKWLATKSRILIFDEPTRGIDVGAKAEIYQLIADLADEGYSIILISSELPEIIGLSDRVIVMHEGRIKGILSGDEIEAQKIMMLATNAN